MDKNKHKAVKFNSFMLIVSVLIFFIVSSMTLLVYGAVTQNNNDSGGYIGRYKPVIVVSGSMLPSIKVNSINIVEKCTLDDINIGDIVMYKHDNGMLITHRAIEYTELDGEKAVVVKGDNNETADNLPVIGGQIRGKIVYTWNGIAPLLSDILPSHGALNPMGILRVILVIGLALTTTMIVIRKVYDACASIYWVSAGDTKFSASMKECKQKINTYGYSIDILEQKLTGISIEKLGLSDKVKIGLQREKVMSSTKNVEQYIDMVNRLSGTNSDEEND